MPVSEELTKEIMEAVKADVTPSEVVPDDEPQATDKAVDEGRKDDEAKTWEEKVVDEKTDSSEDDAQSAAVQDAQDAVTDAADSGKPSVEPLVPKSPCATISDELLTNAVLAGIPIEDAKTFPSNAALQRVISNISSAYRNAQDSKKEVQKEVDPLDGITVLDPEEFEQPEVAKNFNILLETVKKQSEKIREFEGKYDQFSQQSKISAAQETENWVDAKFASLEEEFGDVIGKGKYATMDRGSTQFRKRDAILGEAAALVAGYRASGKDVSRDEVFEKAKMIVLGNEIKAIETKKLSDKLAARSSQHISRVTNNKTKPAQSEEDRIIDLVNAKYFRK